MDKHYYNVNVAWSSQRKGVMCSPELTKISKNDMGCIEVATPPEFPNGIRVFGRLNICSPPPSPVVL